MDFSELFAAASWAFASIATGSTMVNDLVKAEGSKKDFMATNSCSTEDSGEKEELALCDYRLKFGAQVCCNC